MNRAQQLQADAAAWMAKNPNWDKGLPKNPDAFLPRVGMTGTAFTLEEYDADIVLDIREMDNRNAVPANPIDPKSDDKKPKQRNKKVVNLQLVAHNSTEQEIEESEAWLANMAIHADYILSVYKGKYKHVLQLKLQNKNHVEIAAILGKTEKRIRQIVNGNFSKGRAAKPGLLQFITDAMANLPDLQTPILVYSVPVPVLVQPVHCKKKSLQSQAPVGQLAWDLDALAGGAA